MAAINKVPMSPIKKRQYMVIFSLLVIIFALAAAASILFSTKKPVAAPANDVNVTRRNFSNQGDDIDPAQVWRTTEAANLKNMKEELAAQQRQIEQMRKGSKDGTPESNQDMQKRIDELQARLDQMQQMPVQGLPPQGDLEGTPRLEPPREPIRGIMRVDVSAPKKPSSAKSGQSNAPDRNVTTKEGESYIPSASFVRGVLLSGLDAPTGGQAQQNPHPAVIEILDMVSMPNWFKSNYKKCRLLANGAGDLSSERAFMRLERMSCVREDGAAFDIQVRGYVADETGKAGMRGRLVSKQGAVLARALLAGVASGIGDAFAEGNYITSTSALGSIQTQKEGKEFELGVSKGVGSALNKLADYYIRTAEQMYPIVEIDAGRPVDIIFTQGFVIPTLEQPERNFS